MPRLIAHPIIFPAAATALVLAIVIMAMTVGGLYQSRAAMVAHTLEVERELARLFADLQESEIAARGYVLVGEQSYLDAFSATRDEVNARIETLARLTADNPEQQQDIPKLRELATDRMDLANRAMGQRQAGADDAAIRTFVAGRGPEITAAIRETINTMESREADLMAVRSVEQRDSGRLLILFGGLVVVSSLVVIVLWLRDRRHAYAALQTSFMEQEAALARLRESQDNLLHETEARASVESQLRQSQKMEAVGQLTGGIAHDFNNMLAVIMSSITLTRKRMDKGDPNIQPLLDAAMDASSRAARLTQRLLAFSRQQPLAPEPLDPNRFLSGLTELLQRSLGESIQIETVLGGGVWKVHADSSQLENAILNLSVNARDAMKDGGRLTLETANVSLDDTYVRTHVDAPPAGQYVMIAVSDSGEGMPPEIIDRVFEPFFTTKPVGAGTGLGLSQVFGFVKQSGGHVRIYSEVGRGTTVKIYLPRHFGDAKEAVKSAPDLDASDNEPVTETILLVEDDQRLRELTGAGLRELGYTVHEAANGADALKLIDSLPTLHCLFTDIVMPNMTGRQLADEAEKRRPGLRVLYTTGYTRNAVVHNGVLDPGVNFIAKPFMLHDLARKLRAVLAGS
jgi:signal transduction histidine kinase/CheY-like chemotaxis protein